jgi:hypothetical protein
MKEYFLKAISSIGKIMPVSLLAYIAETNKVSASIASAICSVVIRPFLSGIYGNFCTKLLQMNTHIEDVLGGNSDNMIFFFPNASNTPLIRLFDSCAAGKDNIFFACTK